MAKGSKDSRYTQGDDILHGYKWYENKEAGTLLDISNWTFQADLVDAASSKLYDLDIDVSALSSSYVEVLISKEITALLTPNCYYFYDLTFRDADGMQSAFYTFQIELQKMRTQWQL